MPKKCVAASLTRKSGGCWGGGALLGNTLGLDAAGAYDAIRAAGNYGERIERNLGPSSAIGLERARNRLWIEGGLM